MNDLIDIRGIHGQGLLERLWHAAKFVDPCIGRCRPQWDLNASRMAGDEDAPLRHDQALYDRHCGGCDERCACCHSVGHRIRDCDDPATLVQSLNQLGVS